MKIGQALSERASWPAWRDEGGIADDVTTCGTLQLFAQHQAKGEFTMKRSVCKFGFAAVLVVGVLAFSAAPAQAQVYVSGYYAPTPVYSYCYPPSYYSSGYASYSYTPAYSWHPYAPAYRPWYRHGGAYVGWRGRWGWYGRGWHGGYRWRWR